MASNSKRYRAHSLPRGSSTEELLGSSRQFFSSLRSGSVIGRDESRLQDRTSQLSEPLIISTPEDIELRSQETSKANDDYSIGRGFRQRARAWRKGMRLPQGRKRRQTVAGNFIDSSINTPHYVKNITSDNLLVRARLRVLRGVESTFIKLLGLFFLLAYAAVDIAQLVLHQQTVTPLVEEVLQILDLLFVSFFFIEVGLRIVGQGKVYFRRWYEVFDFVVVVLSGILTVAFVLVIDDTGNKDATAAIALSSLRLIILGRVLRFLFWGRVNDEQRNIITYVRSKVSQNKRRYVDEDFNLDLTYVTDRVIAMSFPASGSQSLYRNSIQEVGRFLDKMHFGHYRVYNLCSEREYDPSYFHNQVQRILIDDHNVAKFTDMVDFCEDVLTWLEGHKDNVIVVHCKGGKGRTGMMISACLVRVGLFQEARDSLEYFTLRRTDKSRGKKTQGVDTPSQSRYVCYYQQLRGSMQGNLPPPVGVRITTLTLHNISGLGRGDGSDWRFEIFLGDDLFFECSLDAPNDKIKRIQLDSANNKIQIMFSRGQPLVLVDDVKFKFYSSNKSLPTGNDKCQFYFWFHTNFIEDNRLYLERDELDNLHKSKLQRYYPVGFAIELSFERSSDLSGTYSIIEESIENNSID